MSRTALTVADEPKLSRASFVFWAVNRQSGNLENPTARNPLLILWFALPCSAPYKHEILSP